MVQAVTRLVVGRQVAGPHPAAAWFRRAAPQAARGLWEELGLGERGSKSEFTKESLSWAPESPPLPAFSSAQPEPA